MKRIFAAVAMLLLVSHMAEAQLIWEDRFEYAAGTLLEGQGGWEVGTGKWTSGDSPKVIDRKIKYSGYIGSESGCVSFGGTVINRLTYRIIDADGIRKGAVYVAMIVNIESVDGTRDFITFDGGTGDSPRAKLFVKRAGTGFSIGASMSDPKHAVFSRGLAMKSPHLIVLKYTFVESEKGASLDCNDKIELWVNPVPAMPESKQMAVRLVRGMEDKAEDMKAIKSVNIRQCGVKGQICGMRVARSWDAAVKKN